MPNYHYASTRKGNRKFWTRQVQAYHLSGLSQKEFCQKNGL
ncbi:IS66 family insertion sequence element accessory protein TnpA, partial [Ileibacterium valens]